MNIKRSVLVIALLSLLSVTASAQIHQLRTIGVREIAGEQVREVIDYRLNDAAAATRDEHGPMVIYNPQIMRRLDPGVARWVREHEYAHIDLGHVNAPPRNSADAIRKEDAADLAATLALMDDPDALVAVVKHFLRQPDASDGLHSTQHQRAANIVSWMKEYGGYDVEVRSQPERRPQPRRRYIRLRIL